MLLLTEHLLCVDLCQATTLGVLLGPHHPRRQVLSWPHYRGNTWTLGRIKAHLRSLSWDWAGSRDICLHLL